MIKSLTLLIFSLHLLAETDIFDLAAKYNKKKSQVTNLEEKKRKTLSELYAIEKETNKIVLQKTELSEKELKLEAELKDLSKQVVKIEKDISEITPMLNERMAMVDQVNNLPWFYSFITSQSLIELDQIFESAAKINEKQGEQLSNFISLLNDLSEKKTQLKNTAREMVIIRKDIELKEDKIAKNHDSKKIALNSIKRHLNKEKKKLIRLKGKGKKLVSKDEFKNLSLLFGADFYDKKGMLPHPIDTPPSHAFGLNQGLIKDYIKLIHKGHFYGTTKFEKVKAVADGRVKLAKHLKGLGKVVIIDHGGKYYTVYGNLKKVSVKKNQIVKPKAVIGETGFDHLQFGQGLYFEIRHFSQPQNPKDWLKQVKSKLAKI